MAKDQKKFAALVQSIYPLRTYDENRINLTNWEINDAELTTLLEAMKLSPDISNKINNLILSHNKITQFPDLQHFPNLSIVNLDNNQISFCGNLKCTENLTALDLRNNPLELPPPDLKNFTRLAAMAMVSPNSKIGKLALQKLCERNPDTVFANLTDEEISPTPTLFSEYLVSTNFLKNCEYQTALTYCKAEAKNGLACLKYKNVLPDNINQRIISYLMPNRQKLTLALTERNDSLGKLFADTPEYKTYVQHSYEKFINTATADSKKLEADFVEEINTAADILHDEFKNPPPFVPLADLLKIFEEMQIEKPTIKPLYTKPMLV